MEGRPGGGAQLGGRGNGAGEHGFGDGVDRGAQVERRLDRPGARSLHARGVPDHVHQRNTGAGIGLAQHLGGDLNEVGIQVPGVPGGKNVRHLGVAEAQGLQQFVGLADELHVGVLDAVVDHLHEMPGAVGADVGATGFTIHVGGDPLQDRAERLVGLRGSAGHDRGSLQGSDLPSGDPSPHEVQSEVAEALLAAAGVLEERVAAVDDDVPLLEERHEGVDGGVGRATGLDHENDAAGTFQGGDEIRQLVEGREISL